ncbi:unnamed protein product [Rotaria socialis]
MYLIGTVNTGAFDNLEEISLIARAENIWFHVDGAFGSFSILDPQRRHLVAGIDQADSLAFDFHKWLHCPYDAGCVLVRDYTCLESIFSTTPPYLSKPDQYSGDNRHWFFNLGLEIPRSFRALKVWFTVKEHGIVKLGQKIADNCEQAQYLLSLLEKHEHVIHIIRPVSLNIVNIRFEPNEFNKTDNELNDMFNNQLLADIHASGIAFPSSTVIQNRFYIRVCIVSHRRKINIFTLRSNYNIMANIHIKARKSPYSDTQNTQRFPVPDEKVPWNVDWSDYKPTEYTSPIVLKNPPWADDCDAKKIKKFNQVDGQVDRTSYTGSYEVDGETNRPKNPQGRTGLSGRGLLGRWGPNHAGDPLVTRWAKDQHNDKQKVLEIVLIRRKDTGESALPGGMVDAGEHVSVAIKREFIEEAMNSNADGAQLIDELFKTATSVYKGYIDDPRNTDNAWMESEAMNMHDETGELTKYLKLEAGDDAAKVKWVRLDCDHRLYASHEKLIQAVVTKLGAYEYWHGDGSATKLN